MIWIGKQDEVKWRQKRSIHLQKQIEIYHEQIKWCQSEIDWNQKEIIKLKAKTQSGNRE